MGLILRQERKTMIHSALEHSSPLTVRSNKLQKGSKCGKIRVFTNRVRLSEEIFVCGLNSGYVGFSMQFDIVIIGAGAAGLFAAIWAGRTAVAQGHALSIGAIDGAKKLGAKILVAGGGRCNVTHWQVNAADYAGSSSPAIRNVLSRFSADDTVAFFAAAGVKLKREETGKLFPVSDSARTILAALIQEATRASAQLIHPARATTIIRDGDGFLVTTDARLFCAKKVILCSGGKSLPKSGSDGGGYALATSLGHSLTVPLVPSLVPLVLPEGHWIRELSGLTLPAEVRLCSSSGKRLMECAGSTLCTHFGLSGPSILDISRHWLVEQHKNLAAAKPAATLALNWLPGQSAESLERIILATPGRGALAMLREYLPDRLARKLCELSAAPTHGDIPREARRKLVALVTATPLEIQGDRGFTIAEATAGGVPLGEVRLDTLESRVCPGLFFAGEILDVDGRIGGFNFQWAWASGFVAGSAASHMLSRDAKT